MGFEDRMAEQMANLRGVLLPGEAIFLNFYGLYKSGGYNNMMGTWAATNNQLLFIGKAKYSMGGGLIGLATAKSGKVITIPYSKIDYFSIKKHKMQIIHSAEHEGKKPGAARIVTMVPERLPKTDLGKKESDRELISRAVDIFEKIKKLIGR